MSFGTWLLVTATSLAANALLFVPRVGARTVLTRVVDSWDAQWLRGIAQSGYVWNPRLEAAQNPNFLPLYPLLQRYVHELTHLTWTETELLLGLVLQACFLVVVAQILTVLARRDGPSSAIASRSSVRSYRLLVLVAAYPASIFAIQGYATSLVMVLEALAMLAFVRRRTTAAYLWAGIACAADPSALALPVGFALAQWAASRQWSFPVRPRQLAREALGVGGFLASMAYFGVVLHDPLAKLQAGQAWFPRRSAGQVLDSLATFRPIRIGLISWEYALHHARNLSYGLDSVVAILLVLLVAVAWVRGGSSWHVIVPAVGILPLLVQSAEYGASYGITRLSYPLWLALGLHPWVKRSVETRRWLFVLVLVLELAVTVVWAHYLVEQRWLD